MAAWLETPPGQCLLAWQQQALERCVSDVFGYHAVQIGGLALPALHANRMPNRWRIEDAGAWQARVDLPGDEALPEGDAPWLLGACGQHALLTDARALPFAAESLDLLVLPHTLELNPDPHACLREVARVLMNEGQVVVLGINPLSLWGAKQWRAHLWRHLGWDALFLPEQGDFLAPWRVAEWLRVLGFAVTSVEYGCYETATRSATWLARQAWLNRVGVQLWPMLGASYCLTAVKRTESPTLLDKPWSKVRAVKAGRRQAAAAPQSGALRGPEDR